jgi:hypothetical protein
VGHEEAPEPVRRCAEGVGGRDPGRREQNCHVSIVELLFDVGKITFE